MQNTVRTDETRGLVFVHIPKAAGSTFYEVVKRQYPKGSLFHIDGEHILEDIEQLRTMPPGERANMRCIFGHMPLGLHEYLAYPSDYITIMRDPVDRVISLYYYAKQMPDNYLHERVVSQNMSLEDFVTSGITREVDNAQMRYLCGDKAVDTIYGDDPVTDAHFEAAKRNMDEMFLGVGLSERFDETLVLFSKLLGWNSKLYYRNVNVTRSRASKKELPKSTLDTIKKHNEYDIALYQHASKRFEADLQRTKMSDFDMMRHQWINRAYHMYVSTRDRVRGGTSHQEG